MLWGLGQKLLMLVWVTLGLFLGVLSPLFLVDRAASALGLWYGVEWWCWDLVIRVLEVMEGTQ
jgi:hypothetical protein